MVAAKSPSPASGSEGLLSDSLAAYWEEYGVYRCNLSSIPTHLTVLLTNNGKQASQLGFAFLLVNISYCVNSSDCSGADQGRKQTKSYCVIGTQRQCLLVYLFQVTTSACQSLSLSAVLFLIFVQQHLLFVFNLELKMQNLATLIIIIF